MNPSYFDVNQGAGFLTHPLYKNLVLFPGGVARGVERAEPLPPRIRRPAMDSEEMDSRVGSLQPGLGGFIMFNDGSTLWLFNIAMV